MFWDYCICGGSTVPVKNSGRHVGILQLCREAHRLERVLQRIAVHVGRHVLEGIARRHAGRVERDGCLS